MRCFLMLLISSVVIHSSASKGFAQDTSKVRNFSVGLDLSDPVSIMLNANRWRAVGALTLKYGKERWTGRMRLQYDEVGEYGFNYGKPAFKVREEKPVSFNDSIAEFLSRSRGEYNLSVRLGVERAFNNKRVKPYIAVDLLVGRSTNKALNYLSHYTQEDLSEICNLEESTCPGENYTLLSEYQTTSLLIGGLLSGGVTITISPRWYIGIQAANELKFKIGEAILEHPNNTLSGGVATATSLDFETFMVSDLSLYFRF